MALYIGSVDIGGTKTMVGLVDGSGNILVSDSFATVIADGAAHLHTCCTRLRACARSLGIELSALAGIGVNLPGMVDKHRGVLVRAVFAGWNDLAVVSVVRGLTGIEQIDIDNDVNSCAVGELQFGHRDRFQDFLWMTISTGVGGAVVAGGRLLPGAIGCAGEIGHVKVEYQNPARCPCGQLGCLEAQGSGTAITRYTAEAAARSPEFAARLAGSGLAQDASGCAELARRGDKTAAAIYHKAGVYLGRGISYYINILNPRAVVLGGGVAVSFDLLEKTIRKTVVDCVIDTIADVEILPTALGYEAALIGAAARVKRALA